MANIFRWIAQEYRTHEGADRWLFVLGFFWILNILFWLFVLFYATANYGKTFDELRGGYYRLLRGFGIATAVILCAALIALVVALVYKF